MTKPTKPTKPTLLVLAAGMGSRYGGLKQMDPVGPAGETLMDYSIYDAVRAGFGRLVFVIRRDIEEPFKRAVGARFEQRLPVDYVFQELDALPSGCSVPPHRQKPWGTGQAILSAAGNIQESFAVINADDFYGANSFRVLAEHLGSRGADCAMVGFVLCNTFSSFGSVARGVCQVSDDGFLQQVTELTRIEPDQGGVKHTGPDGAVHRLDGDEVVSMNLWGFSPAIFQHLRTLFADFLRKKGQDERAEFYIPAAINELVRAKQIRCRVLPTPDSWFGVTYREDRSRVVESLRELIAAGRYPRELWA